jgi:hypothetical protein
MKTISNDKKYCVQTTGEDFHIGSGKPEKWTEKAYFACRSHAEKFMKISEKHFDYKCKLIVAKYKTKKKRALK